jgi:homoserine O-acetyltransferase
MTTYRSAREFAERFEPARIDDDGTFDVERYLVHHGQRFAANWRPERFLALSLSTDTHQVDPAAITTPAVLIAAEGDTLVPREQLVALSARLAGPNVILDFPTRYGHDAFLAEPERFGETVAHALTLPLP